MEIKIKFWNPINKIMEQPVFTIKDLMERRIFSKEEIDTFIPLLFTGRKDKEGEEIYDGDILQYEEEGMPKYKKTVYWNGSEFILGGQRLTECYLQSLWKIIGNKYESPTLVKK